MKQHHSYMQQAIALAQQGYGYTSPNPLVGCVIVNNGHVVGEGYHAIYGGKHAEVVALNQAGEHARGATLYVNLEPCTHYGKTPPCVHAIIDSGIDTVVIAQTDPNPNVSGQGVEYLRDAGINVIEAIESTLAQQINQVFNHYMLYQQPHVTAKWAMSLDGKLASTQYDSKWITGSKARERVHWLRQASDAIIVGENTVNQDNPRLTVRIPTQPTHHPQRIVISPLLNLTLDRHIFNDADSIPTHIITTQQSSLAIRQKLQDKGVIVTILGDNNIQLPALLDYLANQKISSVMIEGGGATLGQFFQYQLVQAIEAFIAPKLIGGQHAPTPWDDQGVDRIENCPQIAWHHSEWLDQDLWMQGQVIYNTKDHYV